MACVWVADGADSAALQAGKSDVSMRGADPREESHNSEGMDMDELPTGFALGKLWIIKATLAGLLGVSAAILFLISEPFGRQWAAKEIDMLQYSIDDVKEKMSKGEMARDVGEEHIKDANRIIEELERSMRIRKILVSLAFTLIGAFSFIAAWGVWKRKKIGLYTTYGLLVIGPLPAVAEVVYGYIRRSTLDNSAGLAVSVVIVALWFRYFWRRRAWFN